MGKRRKLRTRKGTLGATKEERIASAMESLASSTIYERERDRQRKYIGGSLDSSYRLSSIPIQQRGYHTPGRGDETAVIPSSIKMHPYTFGNYPGLKGTSCSITTSSSLRRGQPPTSPPQSPRLTPTIENHSAARDQPPSSPRACAYPRVEFQQPTSLPGGKEPLGIIPSTSIDSDQGYEEHVEILSMKNADDRSFVRILVSQTPSKPQNEESYGIETKSSLDDKLDRLKIEGEQHQCGFDNIGKKNGEDNNINQALVATNELEKSNKSAESRSMPPILKTMDTLQLELCHGLGDNLCDVKDCAMPFVPSCHSGTASFQKQQQREKAQDRLQKYAQNSIIRISGRVQPMPPTEFTTSYSFNERSATVSEAHIDKQQSLRSSQDVVDRQDDIHAPNYYGIHAIKEDLANSRRKLKFNREISTADAIKLAKKEQEKQAVQEQEKQTKADRKDKTFLKRIGAKLARNKQSKKQSAVMEQPQSPSPSHSRSKSNSSNKSGDYNSKSSSKNRSSRRLYEYNNDCVDDMYSVHSNSNSSSSESEEGYIQHCSFMANGRDKQSRDTSERIPKSVSFRSSIDEGEMDYGDDSRDDTETLSHDTSTIQRDQGNHSLLRVLGSALGFGDDHHRTPQDVRDLRNLDSDISSSGDEEFDESDSVGEGSLSHY